jgi:hypothetical protein
MDSTLIGDKPFDVPSPITAERNLTSTSILVREPGPV